MSTPATTTDQVDETDETAAPEQPGAETEESTETPEGAEEGGSEETEDPVIEGETIEARLERRERELRSVREEAAKRRTQLRELEAKLAEAKTQEDIDAAVSELIARNQELEKQIAVSALATKHGLDEKLTALLTKFPTEELEEQASLLAAYAPRQSGGGDLDDLSGGLNPGRGSVRWGGEIDPSEVVKRTRRRR